ncbi:hypothetical protein RDWZM_009526 [Blomia tropicalis]|uniref:type I protein arginine methyltransferase n=1 Tax=Blomia tropicalis TaxID=40697 RepID=A0A9Q0M3L0_BLOTA|nr:Histone-arginine methyltransferase carm1 [Blomia tropicalis]KAJ6218369.1 hypothetical protein RDWZM_009526 [Blomia tropicalis]
MSSIFEIVYLLDYNEETQSFKKRSELPFSLEVIDESDKLLVRSINDCQKEKGHHESSINGELPNGGSNGLAMSKTLPSNSSLLKFEIEIYKDTPCAEFGKQSFIITDEDGHSVQFRFGKHFQYDGTKSNYTESDICRFSKLINDFKLGRRESVFTLRTDESSATQYFQFYGYLSQQQNMMQDFIRTSTYQRAILSNMEDFRGKVVLDVGAGSGILSFFAVQAGAKKVYAVEASSMAKHAETLVQANKFSDRIKVIPGKIEEIQLPEQVDIIISEPMGYMLFNERMLETYLHAKKWLAPNGNMFPTQGDLHIAPFSDAQLYTEQLTKANFWFQHNFHGVDLNALRNAALKEYLYQPVVDTFDIRICIAKSNKYSVDFLKAHENDLHTIDIPLKFKIMQTDEIHGLAFWFDVAFFGSQQSIWLSTAPTQPLTHWYQVRCLLDKPLFAQRGHTVSGRVVLISNKRQSYNVQIELNVDDIPGTFASNTLDLKNPFFRYTGQPIQAPPGCNTTSPSEDYWQQLDSAIANAHQQPMVNGATNGTTNGILLNGTTLTNGLPIAALNSGVQSLQQPVNLTAQFDASQVLQATPAQAHQQPQQQSTMQAFNLTIPPNQPQISGVAINNHMQNTFLNASNQSSRITASPGSGLPITNAYGTPVSMASGGSATGSGVIGQPSIFPNSAIQGSSNNVAGINNMNFPVNQSLMIGDYAAAVGGQTISPFKPM